MTSEEEKQRTRMQQASSSNKAALQQAVQNNGDVQLLESLRRTDINVDWVEDKIGAELSGIHAVANKRDGSARPSATESTGIMLSDDPLRLVAIQHLIATRGPVALIRDGVNPGELCADLVLDPVDVDVRPTERLKQLHVSVILYRLLERSLIRRRCLLHPCPLFLLF